MRMNRQSVKSVAILAYKRQHPVTVAGVQVSERTSQNRNILADRGRILTSLANAVTILQIL